MPIYEYECEKCGQQFEQRREIYGEEKELKCPVCGAERPKRVYSAFGTSCQGCAPPEPWFARGGG